MVPDLETDPLDRILRQTHEFRVFGRRKSGFVSRRPRPLHHSESEIESIATTVPPESHIGWTGQLMVPRLSIIAITRTGRSQGSENRRFAHSSNLVDRHAKIRVVGGAAISILATRCKPLNCHLIILYNMSLPNVIPHSYICCSRFQIHNQTRSRRRVVPHTVGRFRNCFLPSAHLMLGFYKSCSPIRYIKGRTTPRRIRFPVHIDNLIVAARESVTGVTNGPVRSREFDHSITESGNIRIVAAIGAHAILARRIFHKQSYCKFIRTSTRVTRSHPCQKRNNIIQIGNAVNIYSCITDTIHGSRAMSSNDKLVSAPGWTYILNNLPFHTHIRIRSACLTGKRDRIGRSQIGRNADIIRFHCFRNSDETSRSVCIVCDPHKCRCEGVDS